MSYKKIVTVPKGNFPCINSNTNQAVYTYVAVGTSLSRRQPILSKNTKLTDLLYPTRCHPMPRTHDSKQVLSYEIFISLVFAGTRYVGFPDSPSLPGFLWVPTFFGSLVAWLIVVSQMADFA